MTVVVGCRNIEKVPDIANVISIAHIADSICFDSIICDYQYIELSHENGFLLGEIEQVLISQNRIYVSSNGVYCYDMKGRPLFKITCKGHARNEFTECTSISINDDMIYLYDRQTRLIHRYNSKDGTFIDNISVPVIARAIYKITNEYIIDNLFPLSLYKGDARIITTKDFSKINGEYLEGDQYDKAMVGQVTYCNNSVIFADYDGHSLFCFNEDGCTQYDIQCNDVTMVPMVPQDILDNSELRNSLIDDSYTRGLSMVYENNTHLIGAFVMGTPFNFVYNKQTNNITAFRFYYSEKYQLSSHNVRGVCDDSFICVITPESYDFLEEVYGFGSPLPATHPDYEKQKILMEHNVDGNPIIAIYKFKDF